MADRHTHPVRELVNPDALRLLAQPTRLRIMAQLRHGPANSTTLARALGESTALTSYHLRQMAQHGFVEEVPELAHGRERWWRSVRADFRFPPRNEQTPETREIFDEIRRLDFAADLEDFARFQLEQDGDGEWAGMAPFSRGIMHVTAAELMEFFEEYIELLRKYQRPEQDAPPGARTVLTRFIAFPAPAPPGAGNDK